MKSHAMSILQNLDILSKEICVRQNVKVRRLPPENNRRVSRFEQRTLILNRKMTIRSSVEKKSIIRERANNVKPRSLFREDIIPRVCFVILIDGMINDRVASIYSSRVWTCERFFSRTNIKGYM